MRILKKYHYCVYPGSLVDEMSHIIPQRLYMMKFFQAGFCVDKYVDLKNIRTFIEADLKSDFQEYNGGGKNSGKIDESCFKYVRALVDDCLTDEYMFYDQVIKQ